ncbi:CLUMA_CG000429, isoform A [Clunio marinus]|uniref:CLUMA_CG000429, isoform A n=1 Tax=Clunio marinus TaxID=568069 RepID=A0A1J1HF56_9DIPT|nr:CLUMA_CG000429, isoform A [Clunio marinus]
MARLKSFFGSDLKTGSIIIGYVSLFANLLYLILDIEAVLVFVLEQSNEKRELFGSFINELNASSVAFPIILFALVASLYGVIASLLLICGVCTANRKRVLWWLIYQPIAILTLLFYVALHVYFFIVIIEYYLQLKALDPEVSVEEPEIKVVKEEELQLIETQKVKTTDETDKSEDKLAEEENTKETSTKEEGKTSKIRCPELPKCPSLKCPSWGNCVGPDNFE